MMNTRGITKQKLYAVQNSCSFVPCNSVHVLLIAVSSFHICNLTRGILGRREEFM